MSKPLSDKEIVFKIPVFKDGKETPNNSPQEENGMHYPLVELVIRGSDNQGSGWFGASRKSDPVNGHNGIDLLAPIGTPVYAVTSGTIIIAKEIGKAGKTIMLKDSSGRIFAYLHLSEFIRTEGKVKPGELIGKSGDSGNAGPTPPHLHFGVKISNKYVDPATVFPAFKHPMTNKKYANYPNLPVKI